MNFVVGAVILIAVAIVTVGTLGAGGITAAPLAGQLAASVVIDRLGILGLAEREISAGRVAVLFPYRDTHPRRPDA